MESLNSKVDKSAAENLNAHDEFLIKRKEDTQNKDSREEVNKNKKKIKPVKLKMCKQEKEDKVIKEFEKRLY